MTSIAPVRLTNIAKNKFIANELVQQAMKNIDELKLGKSKKVLPKPIEGDQFIKLESKNSMSACDGYTSGCGYSADFCGAYM